MAAFCINVTSPAFKETAKRLGVSEFELEQIAFKYGNQDGTFGQFPSDEYIKERLDGVPNYDATEAQAELWKLRYSTPREFDTLEGLNAAKKDALQYFDDSSVHSFVNADGKYELRVAEHDNEYQRIKEQAIKDGTFMLAPNGNRSNLTEQQWIQVRTKAFKRWFGDWENDPTNASKVVDENGEPKVVYIGSERGIWDSSYNTQYMYFSDSRNDAYLYSLGQFTKGGQLFERNTDIKDGINAYISSLLGRKFNMYDLDGVYDEETYNKYKADFDRLKKSNATVALLEEIFDLIDYTTLRTENDLFRQYDDFEYTENKQILDRLLKENKELIDRIRKGQKRGIVDAVFLNIKNPYVDEINSEDLTLNSVAYRSGHDGAFLLGGEHFLVKGTSQIKSATENRGTFLENDPGIYNQESSDTGNVTGLPDQMTADEAYQRLSQQYDPNSSEAKLSKLVFGALQKTGIVFKKADLPADIRGRFKASDNVILFSSAGVLDNTLLHEAIHAVSVYYMSAVNRDGFSDEIKIAIREIEECYELLKEYLLDRETKNGGSREAIFGYLTSGFDRYYGLSSATELVAEITNPDIVNLIREFDSVHKGKNIFKRLIDAIAKFFGINKTYGSLEKTLKEALVTLIENPNTELMQRYALENSTFKKNYSAIDSTKNTIIFTAREQAEEALGNAEFNEDGEYDTTLVVPLDYVTSGYIYQKVPGAHHELTQSPIGAIFQVYSSNGFGTFLLNGVVRVSEKDNTVSIPIKAVNAAWLQTHTFDIATSENGVAYMTNIKPLFGSRQEVQKSFGQPQRPPQESIDIWAGQNPTNADLSNMAERPFVFQNPIYEDGFGEPVRFNSVEQAFQAYKLRYTDGDGTALEDIMEQHILKASSFDAREIGKKIKGLRQAEWDAHKYDIMKVLIKESFKQNPQALQRLLATGDATLTHNRDNSVWKTEFPRILMEVRSELRAEQQVDTTTEPTAVQSEPLYAPPVVERDFHEKEVTVVTQMNNLYSSDLLTVTDIRDEADKVMNWISDQLTQYLENPEIVWKKYKSKENREEVIEKVSGMSRKELLQYIRVGNLVEHYKAEVLSYVEDTENPAADNTALFDADESLFDVTDLLRENIEGLIQYGIQKFRAREGFGFQLSDVPGETYVVTDEINPEDQENPDDFNPQNEEVLNQQEHWIIDNSTRDIMDNASIKVKQAIADCYVLEDNGKKNPDGSIKYDIAKDRLNRDERVVPIKAVRQIIRWTQGALTLSQMVAQLSSKTKSNPWITQIITRLQDTSGKESDFQSQFFNTFCKHFQTYSIVKKRADGTYYTMEVNVHPALKDAMTTLGIMFRTGGFPLVNENGKVVSSNLEVLKAGFDSIESFGDVSEDTRDGIVDAISHVLAAIGLPQPTETISKLLTTELKNEIWAAAKNIWEELNSAAKENKKDFNPFEYGGDHSIRGYVQTIIKPFTNELEETAVSSVFDSGKMYQSYITPSWTTKLFQKMHLPDREFGEFLLSEFGTSEWFIDTKVDMLRGVSQDRLAELSDREREELILQTKLDYIKTHPTVWRTPWLQALTRMSESQRQEMFQHKVQLNFDKQNYMRGMNDLEYVMSVFTEYFAEAGKKGENGLLFANYGFPMLSNKPSNEFVRFVRYVDPERTEILDGLVSIFEQELSRIQTVEARNLMEGDPGYIANFDIGKKGKTDAGNSFKFLDYLNEYLYGKKKGDALGILIDRSLHATEDTALSREEIKERTTLVKDAIREHLNTLAANLVEQYRRNGLFEALKNIEGVGKSDYDVVHAIEEFVWNNNFAQANLLQLLVTDKAFYKNEEDLQKRLAQVHSPGIRGNWEARDFGDVERGVPPRSVSDGKVRVLKLADYGFDKVKDGIISNLEAIFDKKIAMAAEDSKEALRALKQSIIDAYGKINVVDGQAFVGPTAYRKKAIAFGEWTREDEEVYNKLMAGKANIAEIQRVFNPRKPFTYGKVTKAVNASKSTPIKSLRYGVQYKDSEYLLIMADALMRGENTGRPNLLGAIFDVMEESAKSLPTMGIDFVVFESGVKTGLQGAIDIGQYADAADGRRLAFNEMWDSAFISENTATEAGETAAKTSLRYNENFVDVLDAEDYTTQQTVPEHFMHGDLQWGSQVRALMPSDLETTFGGEPVVYEYTDPATGEPVQKSAKEIREAWEQNTASMIKESIGTLREELGLSEGMSLADSNVLISKILQREILGNPRYGVDLLLACAVDADGNFRIPLGDPIQSKRIEQLLNSIIKNRINKQKVEGGTLVEVTNFGATRRLNVRFKDKSSPNKLLDTQAEYIAKGHTEGEYKQYVKENQGGIAYYECFAPAWMRDLYQKFADRDGNIDVEAIEMLDPDLLKMYGYRIPTEDKYSTAPYKIVGFLPREAGDGFMQPWETTVIDGSDFDVDKKNLMRMALDVKSALLSKKEFYDREGITEETEDTKEEYAKYRRREVSAAKILDKIVDNTGNYGKATLSKEERKSVEWYAESRRQRRLSDALMSKYTAEDEAVDDVDIDGDLTRTYTTFQGQEIEYQPLKATIDALESKEELTSEDEKRIEKYKKALKKIDAKYAERERKIEDDAAKDKQRDTRSAEREKRIRIIRQILQDGVFRDSSTLPASQRALFKAVKQAYIDLAFKVDRPKSGKDYYNNMMFNMQWSIATHESTADKMLNPGNFDPQKRMGYMVAAARLGYSWDSLQSMSTSQLKDLIMTSKNLMDFDVQTQFYRQNAVAGQILGIFAVAKSAHAMFEGRDYGINMSRRFYIDGMEFNGIMRYDQGYDRTGVTLIGKTLGSLVSASADAVKDPVLNFMNINKETVNVLNTALRLGLDFETISLLLSSKAVTDVLDSYRRRSLSGKTSFESEVKRKIRELEKKSYIGKDSPLQFQNITKEEMVWAINEVADAQNAQRSDEIVYKILNAVLGLSEASRTAQPLTDLSRLNSITSAPGPLHINTIASDLKIGPSMSMEGIVKFKTSYKDPNGGRVHFGNEIGNTGIVLSEDNLEQMIASKTIEEFEDYESVSREDVFSELPSLEQFYQGYSIVKGLFKRLKFTTASDRFNEVLGSIPKELRFTIYSNDKLLSGLADFFQSYLLVQSGVVKASDLKRYTTEFVEDFISGKYTSDEKTANNPLIRAIQPKVISKKGEPERYALEIDTTGMEQSEKDELSAGWAQLEKDNPSLSHMLFVYNFFRGGIGFNPKSFMALMPIQVKERIAGYLETFTTLPKVDGPAVVDQWIRNNWTNVNLVPKITGILADASTSRIELTKGQMFDVNNAPYIRVSTDGGDFLFRQTAEGSNIYAQITPFGNNREYLEMYPSFADAKIDPAQRGVMVLTTEESDIAETREDNPEPLQTAEEQSRDLADFYQIAFGEERTRVEDAEHIDESFERINKDLEIQTDKSKFEDIMDSFC